ncbi:membrane-bound lytic murein transglycosylase MltF [Marinicella sp. S1101]|uniref:membrane-bound lytic murein transglycosylase MltF n=1 Tax=Marinicella marina TaxID=2996016 RepID=UPI002260A455|nr:membrane-bound lytic murein transglycosylase MltF [Marinicella marina]MCX7553493.1 membrane-bound lytic murein transglycosylase MltF [Marinicella marina]MDJ1140117.1 membrane-bound lytic murein transglycosylase MltF [Marinicella marina]
MAANNTSKFNFFIQHKKVFLWVFALLLTFSIISPWVMRSTWDLIQKRGEILYGTRTSLLSYFKSGETIIGYEYQLLKAFADENNLIVKPILFNNNGDMFDALDTGAIDVAGGHLTITKQRAEKYQFTDPISETAIDLVTHFNHRNAQDIREFEDKSGMLIANSSYAELLDELDGFKPVDLVTSNDISLFELIRKVNSKDIDYTFGDSEIINIYQYFIPGIYQTIQLSEPKDTAMLMRKYRSSELKLNLDQFIEKAKTSGLLQQLKDEILLHLPDIDSANTVTFFDKLQTTWPEIEDLVYEVADKYQFDRALLAAISYQESHWEIDAESFTGVKGLMMLTASAAKDMNIEDRTDPRQSLAGGVKYFRHMKRKMPERIAEPHRTFFALAAYNVGFGHLEDARILTQRAGMDPDNWFEVESFLPKLNNPSIAHELRYGNADGATAVIYVNNIMTYQQLMNWKINKEQKSEYTTNGIL